MELVPVKLNGRTDGKGTDEQDHGPEQDEYGTGLADEDEAPDGEDLGVQGEDGQFRQPETERPKDDDGGHKLQQKNYRILSCHFEDLSRVVSHPPNHSAGDCKALVPDRDNLKDNMFIRGKYFIEELLDSSG